MSHISNGGAPWTLVLAGAVVLTTGCQRERADVAVERAAVTLDVVGASAAAYFTVVDDGRDADSVVGLIADAADEASLQQPNPHRLPMRGGAEASYLMEVPAVPIGRNGRVRFAPGGNTGVLGELRRALVVGDSVQLTITLASGRSASVIAPVLAFVDLERALSTSVDASSVSAEPSLAEGLALYQANGCASCHGPDGFGDGPVGLTLIPPPRDFRDSLSFRAGRDAEAIARMLAVGIIAGGNMPQYAHLTNQERASLALYVISLRTSSPNRNTLP